MDTSDIIRFLHGLLKKHNKDFSVRIKYLTSKDKVRKRYGEFVDLIDDSILVLYNREKGAEGRYEVEKIVDIKKK